MLCGVRVQFCIHRTMRTGTSTQRWHRNNLVHCMPHCDMPWACQPLQRLRAQQSDRAVNRTLSNHPVRHHTQQCRHPGPDLLLQSPITDILDGRNSFDSMYGNVSSLLISLACRRRPDTLCAHDKQWPCHPRIEALTFSRCEPPVLEHTPNLITIVPITVHRHPSHQPDSSAPASAVCNNKPHDSRSSSDQVVLVRRQRMQHPIRWSSGQVVFISSDQVVPRTHEDAGRLLAASKRVTCGCCMPT